MCQRATGSVSIAFKNVKQADVTWANGPDWFDSSAIARRRSARPAAPRLAFSQGGQRENSTSPSPAFDDPSRFKPKHHFAAESMHRAWLNTEGLPEIRPKDHQKLSTNGSRRRGSA